MRPYQCRRGGSWGGVRRPRIPRLQRLLRSPRDTRQRAVASPSPLPRGAERECSGSSAVPPVAQTISAREAPSPSPLNGERIRRASSRIEPLNPGGTRSTASPSSGLQLGTQWNASLPVPAGRFMGRAGVRGETVENPSISAAHLPNDRPHLTLPSPHPPGAEREVRRTPVACPTASPVYCGGILILAGGVARFRLRRILCP
jgi:hypothetical protein